MKKLYYIDILIRNDHGELADVRRAYTSLDEARNLDINDIVNLAEDWGKETGMLYEELFDSKEDFEKSKTDVYDPLQEGSHDPVGNGERQ